MISFLKKYWSGILVVFVFLAILFNIINENRKLKLLENSKIIKGILTDKYTEGKNKKGTFMFQLGDKKIEFSHIGNFSFLQKGDTVLIEYAIEDPSVARVKDRYYMKKYKYLKNR